MGKNDLTILGFILYSLLPGGPLLSRILDLDGSVDHAWLLFPLFMMFPFSIIPMFFTYFKWIKNGPGGSPYDWFMLIPMILKFALTSILPNYIESEMTLNILTEVLIIISIAFVKIIRTYEECTKLKKDNSITFNKIRTAINNSIYLGAITNIFYIMYKMLVFIPGIGQILMIINFLFGSYIDAAIWQIGFVLTYIIINMFDQGNINRFCDMSSYTRLDGFRIFFSLVLYLVSYISSYV